MNFKLFFRLVCATIHFIIHISPASAIREKVIILEQAAGCANNAKNPIKIIDTYNITSNRSVVGLGGLFEAETDISGPLVLVVYTNRCDMEMKSCQPYNHLALEKICQKLADKNAFYSSFLNAISPPFTCPIKKGMYEMKNGLLDLSIISRYGIGIDGYRWITYLKMFKTTNSNAKQNEVMCLDVSMSFATAKRSKKN